MSGQQISDEEALKALLSSAESRAQEREANRGASSRQGTEGRGRGSTRHDFRGGRGRGGRWGDRGSRQDNDDRKRSRWNEEASYYGPSDDNDRKRSRRQEQDADDSSSRPIPRVEPEEKEQNKSDEEEKPKQPQCKPNFGLSGALAKDMQSGNVYKGVVLKFKEPPEARAPNTQWRFYVFKKGQKDVVEILHISKQSAYLMGRNTEIADIPMHHPSLSSQHAVLQYRALPNASAGGRLSCQPYIMDLESTNGTFLNGVPIDSARYYQLKKGDILTFGASTREYVLLTENSTSTG